MHINQVLFTFDPNASIAYVHFFFSFNDTVTLQSEGKKYTWLEIWKSF